MSRATKISTIQAAAFDVPMREPFAIAGGSTSALAGVLVRVRLGDGSVGWGEAAPFAAFNGDTQARVLRQIEDVAGELVGLDAAAWRPVLEHLEHELPLSGAARAGVAMAVLDAWTRSVGIPLRRLFGGASTTVESDVTVALVEPESAREHARRIVGLGVRTIKIKVGAGLEADEARIRAVAAVAPRAALLLDANQGASARESLRLLRRLRRVGIVPVLFEQPTAKDDWEGLADVHRLGRVRVAADESVSSRADAAAMARAQAVQVVNVKLMKSGFLEALDIATICRTAGIGLMIGAMVESPLALTAAAHLAAGLGGFEFVDLDTSLWLARSPTRGVRFGRGGRYDLDRVRAGIGVTPIDPRGLGRRA